VLIDLNCDMGEGMSTDKAIFPFISSANIACGGHAGDVDTMQRTVELSLQHNVAIGAHPSYPDRDGFGRSDILETAPGKGDGRLQYALLADLLLDQLMELQKICTGSGTRLRHVKPHGALYNRAAKDAGVSEIICRAILAIDPQILLYGLSGSEMKRQAAILGLRFVNEVFADRTYRADGNLTPRTESFALIDDPALATKQVIRMVQEGRVMTNEGIDISIVADTVCIHGDGSRAVEFARQIRGALLQKGITVTKPLPG
jgi:5-oxoprolinase (ATP-hydrolysing) subunit A